MLMMSHTMEKYYLHCSFSMFCLFVCLFVCSFSANGDLLPDLFGTDESSSLRSYWISKGY